MSKIFKKLTKTDYKFKKHSKYILQDLFSET